MNICKLVSVLSIILLCVVAGCTTSTKDVPIVTTNDKNMTVTFIDVGQGDSEWIEFPNGKTLLIDAGSSNDASKIKSVIGNRKQIDYAIVTHDHTDHIGGMPYIFSEYTIGREYDNGGNSESYQKLWKLIDSKLYHAKSVRNGEILCADSDTEVKVISAGGYSDMNENSLVVLVTYKNVSFLFTGDAGFKAEADYARLLKHVNILKVGHHGSSTSTGPYLLSKTHPDVAVIEVGKDNSYNHPDVDTLNRIKQSGADVYRTDVNGDIVITTNGEQYSIFTER